MTLGRLDQAEQLLSPLHREARVSRLGMVMGAREDRSALAAFLLTHAADMNGVGRLLGSLWFEAGLLDQAREATTLARQPLYDAQLALAEGRYEEAVSALQQQLRNDKTTGSPGIYRGRRKRLLAVADEDHPIKRRLESRINRAAH